MMVTERLSLDMDETTKAWTESLEDLPDEADDENKVDKTQVKKFIDDLMVVRKSTAEKYEKFVDGFFDEFKEKFTEEEIGLYKAKMKEWHDARKLIERK